MRVVRLFLGTSIWPFLLAAFAGIISGLTTTALLALVSQAIRTGRLDQSIMGIGFVSLCVLRLFAGIGAHRLLISLSQGTLCRLRLRLCTQILHTPLASLEELGSHRLLAALTEDLSQVATVALNFPYLLVNLVIVAGCLIYLGYLSWSMLAGIGIAVSLGALSYGLAVVGANRLLRQARQRQDQLFKYFRQLLEGGKELKLHQGKGEEFFEACLRPTADAVRRDNTRGISFYAAAANWNRLLFFLYVGLLLSVGGRFGNMSAPILASYILVILYMMAPIEAILNLLPHVAQADVALRQIESLGLTDAPTQESITGFQKPFHLRQIELRDVSYRYPSAPDTEGFTLGPLSLTIRPGCLTFVTGGNGTGKTTLAKLLTGLYTPTTGSISVDGQLVTAEIRSSYCQLFSGVFSEYGLFDQLLGFESTPTDESCRHLLQHLHLDHKVQIQQGIFSTTAVSQGQRKRLALLVALLEDRPVYVFDEWAADQDPQFRMTFYHQILPDLARKGKAVVVITHDDRYFHLADELLKLDDGHLEVCQQQDADPRRRPADDTQVSIGNVCA